MKKRGFWFHVWGYRPRFLTGLLFWWNHRHETQEEYEARLVATHKRFREIWIAHREAMSIYPETREMQEIRERLDRVILGNEILE